MSVLGSGVFMGDDYGVFVQWNISRFGMQRPRDQHFVRFLCAAAFVCGVWCVWCVCVCAYWCLCVGVDII